MKPHSNQYQEYRQSNFDCSHFYLRRRRRRRRRDSRQGRIRLGNSHGPSENSDNRTIMGEHGVSVEFTVSTYDLSVSIRQQQGRSR